MSDFIPLNDTKAVQELSKAYEDNRAINRAQANYGRTFENWTNNTSIRSEYVRSDYDSFRPTEKVHGGDGHEPIKYGMKVYDKVGIVRNIIDLQSDFTCKGIRLVHKDTRLQKFYREWFEYVKGQEVSSKFTNLLYRIANVPVYRTFGTIDAKIEDKWKSAYGLNDIKKPNVEKRKIPLRYTFLNPCTLQPLIPEFSKLFSLELYSVQLSGISVETLKNLTKNSGYKNLVNLIPEDIKKLLKTGEAQIPLDADKFSVYFYKKDDWCTWAKPMTYAIMDDIIELEKMKLADVSALDGAISNIRLWKIGFIGDSPANTLIPTASMLNKLRNILANNVGGGVIDLVWGPELDFKESSTQVHNFLGIEKYEPVLHNIYKGLGMPIGGTGTYSNNFLDMQTFIERLEYGRSVLTQFWNEEIKKVQLAMGFNTPAKVQYDKITVGDETGMMKLIIELWDRGIISDDMLQESFDYFPEIVTKKLQKEYKRRQTDILPPKAGPYFNYHIEDEFKKILLQSGGVAPSELGVELLEKKDGQKTNIEMQGEQDIKVAKNTPRPVGAATKGPAKKYKPAKTNGRPKNSKDTVKRKKRITKAESKFMNTFLWALGAQKIISDTLTSGWVKDVCGKKDIRSLTTAESEEFEKIKFGVLCNLEPFQEVTLEHISSAFQSPKEEFEQLAKAFVYSFIAKNKREPNMDEKRQIQSSAYAMYFEEEQIENESNTEEELNNDTLNILGN